MAKTETQAGKAADVGFFKHAARELTIAALRPTVLRSKTIDNNHSIDRAKEILRNGKGLIVIINHFSLKDPPQAVSEVLHHTVMGSKKIITPIAYHMNSGILRKILNIYGVTLKPIVTNNTVKEGKSNGHELNDGMAEYFSESMELLKEGGIIVLAPQGTRMSHLGEPDPKNLAIGALMAATKKNGIGNKCAIVVMGLGIKGVDDYSQKKEVNLFSKYTVNIGACLTFEEVLAEAEKMAEESGETLKKLRDPLRFVDKVVYRELRKIVPDNYKD